MFVFIVDDDCDHFLRYFSINDINCADFHVTKVESGLELYPNPETIVPDPDPIRTLSPDPTESGSTSPTVQKPYIMQKGNYPENPCCV